MVFIDILTPYIFQLIKKNLTTRVDFYRYLNEQCLTVNDKLLKFKIGFRSISYLKTIDLSYSWKSLNVFVRK